MSGLIFTVDIVINQMCNFAKKSHIFINFYYFSLGNMEIALFKKKFISSNTIGKINFIQSFEETILYFLGLEALCIGRKHNYIYMLEEKWDTLGHPVPFLPRSFFYANDW